MKYLIRKARHQDASKIISAHRRSIREVCHKDYSSVQIEVWSGRDFQEERWRETMDRDLVWVISNENDDIFGFGHFALRANNCGEIAGFYFVPEVIGSGFGKKMVKLILEECRQNQIQKLILTSTKTAKPFYQSCGFVQVGEEAIIQIGGKPVECFHMELKRIN